MLNNFIYSQSKGLFLEQLQAGNVPEDAIAFLEDSGEIWNRNHYFGTAGVNNLLTEGKLIGTVTANNNPYNIYAPKTYDWSEITSKPTTLAGYRITDAVLKQDYINLNDLATVHAQVMGYGNPDDGWKTYSSGILSKVHDNGFALQGLANTLFFRGIGGSVWDDNWYEVLHEDNYSNFLDSVYLKQSGGTISGALTIQSGDDGKLIFDNTDTETYWSLIYFKQNGETYGRFGTQGTTDLSWNNSLILHSGNYESVVGNKFLKLSGGTLTDSVMVNHSSGSKGYLLLTNGASIGGLVTNGTAVELFNVNGYGIGVEGTSDVYVLTNWTKKTMLHAGNYGSVLNDAYFRVFSGGTYNANTISAGGMYRVEAQYEGGESWPIPPAYGNVIHVKVPLSDTAFQIAAPQYSTQRLFFRSFANSTQATQTWKEFAFTDSNVASATKLQTARSLWGVPFDGTADVNTHLTLNANDAALSAWKKDGSSASVFLQVNPDRHLLIGQGTARENGGLYLYGNDIRMCYGNAGSSNNTAMLINSSGNVTIGSSDLAGADYRLYVNAGRVCFASVAGEAPTLGTMSNMAVAVGLTEYGMQSYVLGNGSAHIQVGRFDGTAAAYSLCLNPLGGNVGIGTTEPQYKLDVNGAASIGTSAPNNALMLDVRGKMRISPNYFNDGYSEFDDRGSRLFYISESYGWANGTYVYKRDGTSLASFHMVGDANSFSKFTFRIGGTECLAINSSGITISGDLKVTGNIIADGQVSSGGIEINPTTISTQISQLNATVEDLQSTVKLLQDELNSLK